MRLSKKQRQKVDINKFAPEIVKVPVSKIGYAPWNPNTMDELGFNLLVKSLDEIGLAENVGLFPVERLAEEYPDYQSSNPGVEWVTFSGEHRVRAVKELDPDGEVNAVVVDAGLDELKTWTVRFNVLRGRLDPRAFFKLFREVAATKGDAAAEEMMGLAHERALDELYEATKRSLPWDRRDLLRRDKCGSVADLAREAAALTADIPVSPAVPPGEFPEYGEGIATAYRCPKCGYEWSGKPK